MIKVLSRSYRAKTQARKVLIRFNKKKEALRLKEDMRHEKLRLRAITAEARLSRQEMKEDRMLGPLAPRRALTKKEAEEYGVVSEERLTGEYVPKDQRIKYWNIVVGDRVVILKGHDRHKIGVVKSLDKPRNCIMVEGMNMVPGKIPAMYVQPGQSSVAYREAPVKYSDVRLVYPLTDPETGILKDTVIANIERSGIWFDRLTRRKKWDRQVPGMEGVTIPWPEKDKPDEIDKIFDTRILDVETKTFTPSLLTPPFPGGVIDELRNKYSRFRTRHDPEYIAKKQAEDVESHAKATARVVTPVQEINKRARAERKGLGKPVLSEEMLEKIGRVMAQNRPELLAMVQTGSAGLETVPAGSETVAAGLERVLAGEVVEAVPAGGEEAVPAGKDVAV